MGYSKEEIESIAKAIQQANRADEIKIIDDILGDIAKRSFSPFDIVYVDLSIDRSANPQQVTGAGTFIIAADASDDTAECSIGIGTNESDENRRISLKDGKRLYIPYTEFFIYNDAQAGKWMKLIRGRELPSLKVGVEDDSGTAAGDSVAIAMGNSNTFAVAQVAVNGSADQIKAANTSRRRIKITNLSSGDWLFIGPTAGVLTTTGDGIPPGGAVVLNTTSAVYGITTGAAIQVSYLEE
jgi:hypothetical protein